ncbi:MAG: monooxygenase [Halieaceae bacterium]
MELEIMGGVAFSVDGQDFDFPASWSYRGMMYSGLPNLVTIFGYINASWTLRSDIVGEWFCRLLQHMDRKGHRVVVPQPSVEEANSMQPRPWIEGFSAGYMQRLIHLFPRQGDRSPWINSQDYRREKSEFTAMSMDEAALHYPHSEAVEP